MKTLKNLKIFALITVFCGTLFFISCEKDPDPEGPTTEVPGTSPGTDNPTVPKDPNAPANPQTETINKALLLELVNAQRAQGCDCGTRGSFAPADPVTWNDTLELAAGDHSLDMYTNNFFSHTGSDSASAGDRITRREYSWARYGENIASGYKTEQDVINGWLNSDGHCSNIMNPNFKEMGVAKVNKYWTQVFGTRQ